MKRRTFLFAGASGLTGFPALGSALSVETGKASALQRLSLALVQELDGAEVRRLENLFHRAGGRLDQMDRADFRTLVASDFRNDRIVSLKNIKFSETEASLYLVKGRE